MPSCRYDVQDRKLVVNEREAETVRHIFRRYADLGSVQALKQELDAAGVRSKRRLDRFGRESGGKPLARGALYLMLQNRIYHGEIVHNQQSYPGDHPAIIDRELWEEVQERLACNRIERSRGGRAAEPSLLIGLLYDDGGERMTPTHANKRGTRYRYYVTQSLITRKQPDNAGAGWRVPAGDIEALVEDRIVLFLSNRAVVFSAIERLVEDVNAREAVARQVADLAGRWPALVTPTKRALLQRLVERIDIRRGLVEIAIRPEAIPAVADPDGAPSRPKSAADHLPVIVLSVPARLKRTGMETRLLIEGRDGERRRQPDRSLLRLLAMAHRFNTMVMQQQGTTITALAREAGVSPSYFTRMLRLSFLAPEIVMAILRNRHPLELTAKHLSLHAKLPKHWSDQSRLLGIG